MLNVYKKLGDTPLECLHRFVAHRPELKGKSVTYAGRLDPMAEGVLIFLVGDEIRDKNKFTALDKEYNFEILWGFETDTYDILGRVSRPKYPLPTEQDIQNSVTKYIGKIKQPYPPYSSKPVGGKPLLIWAREGRISEIKIPVADIEIYSFEIIGHRKVPSTELENFITKRIPLVRGDFRQKEVLEKWQEEFIKAPFADFLVTNCRIRCSSGTYVRGIANSMGKDLGCGALALSIVREKVGEFGAGESIKN